MIPGVAIALHAFRNPGVFKITSPSNRPSWWRRWWA
jgi:hypothetical protein